MDLWKGEVSGCSDSQLVLPVQHLARNDQKLVARLIVYSGEMDARGLYREHAFPSMFHYLVGELRMSEAEAFLRLQAARLARQYPVVIELLASAAVQLSALRQDRAALDARQPRAAAAAYKSQDQARSDAYRCRACA